MLRSAVNIRRMSANMIQKRPQGRDCPLVRPSPSTTLHGCGLEDHIHHQCPGGRHIPGDFHEPNTDVAFLSFILNSYFVVIQSACRWYRSVGTDGPGINCATKESERGKSSEARGRSRTENEKNHTGRVTPITRAAGQGGRYI